ncbi:DUF2442 domain-containing protein [Halomonas sp. HNIBRBA4712]|uniref:DUF2442 domain-containing protein n=1 Tax=Halomonas sp. HNIBRBA4712 TaxID=3373087 RepID=UPI003745BCFB
MLHITSVKYLTGYKIWIGFDDGTSGEVNLDGVLSGPIFEPLKDMAFFKELAVDPELETIVWPNGADLAPEFLKDLCNQQLKPASPVS